MSAVSFLISLAPLALLLIALGLGRFPGEVAIAKVRGLIRSAFSAVSSAPIVPNFIQPKKIVNGGRLIAWALAGRGPPERA